MAASRARGLGVVDASLIVVGSIVGAGIFFVSPSVAEHAGSPVAFIGSWLAGGLIALGGALSNGELGGLYPRSGGEYVYLREAYGPGLGFLSGWTSFWWPSRGPSPRWRPASARPWRPCSASRAAWRRCRSERWRS